MEKKMAIFNSFLMKQVPIAKIHIKSPNLKFLGKIFLNKSVLPLSSRVLLIDGATIKAKKSI